MQRHALAIAAFAVMVPAGAGGPAQRAQRIDEALRRDGEALVRIADAAMAGRTIAADFAMRWRNDYFKAQPGTFVPFTIAFDASGFTTSSAFMYVRAERSDVRARATHAYETIFPIVADRAAAQPVAVRRGFAVPPGRYRVVVVIREDIQEEGRRNRPVPRTAALIEQLEVPDFWRGGLTTSTIMLADRLEPLPALVPADELDEDPYAVGAQRIHLAPGSTFARNRELIVTFLVYNPTVGPDKHFDVQVDYHLYRKDPGGQAVPSPAAGDPAPRKGERYVTRTNPQRFNPSLMGRQFDPEAGAPILAGQGILLSGFDPGEYRLGITVTDLLSRTVLRRDVAFTVIGS